MQYNDLSTLVDKHHVVTLVPTLFLPKEPEHRGWRKFSDLVGRKRPVSSDDFHLNDLMVKWIAHEGYWNNTATEVWSFDPEPLFDDLVERLLRVHDRSIGRTICWPNEDDAKTDLMSSLDSVTRVYDADADRVDRLWQFNGVRVMPGGAP